MGTLGAGRLKYFDLKLKQLHPNASLILQRFNDKMKPPIEVSCCLSRQ